LYAPSVYARCRYLLREEAAAEDAMQEVFSRAILNLPEFRGEASSLTWLIRIATNHCLNQLRNGQSRARALALRAVTEERQAPEGPRLMEIRDQVYFQLQKFDLETQQAAIHTHLDGMTLEEVAACLGRSVPTIRKRLARFSRILASARDPKEER